MPLVGGPHDIRIKDKVIKKQHFFITIPLFEKSRVTRSLQQPGCLQNLSDVSLMRFCQRPSQNISQLGW
jgi:hypothetical protein